MAEAGANQSGVDGLLRPTLADHVPLTSDARRPWRLSSQVYVAFFGGVLAVTVIAMLNARRLRMPGSRQAAIAGFGALGLGAVIVAAAVASLPSGARILVQLISLGAWGMMFLAQRPYDRVHSVFSDRDDDDDYESLVAPGLAAVALLGVPVLALVVSLGES